LTMFETTPINQLLGSTSNNLQPPTASFQGVLL
jgi:hypothetical protein